MGHAAGRPNRRVRLPADPPPARGRVAPARRTEGPASPAARALRDVRDALPVPADPHLV
ncbi:hypothetical protein ABZZ44_19075 [Streptomyces sp. NPDC006460]|uniref:hypothetical protein n=1 Tax=Streptomyces sp. NPDC006460 TaxID=3154304 RepID=UPI0033BC7A54